MSPEEKAGIPHSICMDLLFLQTTPLKSVALPGWRDALMQAEMEIEAGTT